MYNSQLLKMSSCVPLTVTGHFSTARNQCKLTAWELKTLCDIQNALILIFHPMPMDTALTIFISAIQPKAAFMWPLQIRMCSLLC